MDILVFLLIGLVAGWLASKIVDGRGFGIVGDLIVGVIGAFIGGYIFRMMGITAYGFWGAFGMAVVGAVVLLFIVDLFVGSRRFGRLGRKV